MRLGGNSGEFAFKEAFVGSLDFFSMIMNRPIYIYIYIYLHGIKKDALHPYGFCKLRVSLDMPALV